MTIRDILDTLNLYVENGGIKADLDTEVFIEAPDETYRIAGMSESLISQYDQEPRKHPVFVVSTED